ncbi:MAG TPA: HisA/HisF-related TIM barrel protein [Limnobacter sp.]|nr:HisA/HisF-related TIM barrel protein [Limnobacter sp.]
MLKRRIIPIELLLGDRLVKTQAFGTYRDVGDPVKSSQVYSDQSSDELLLLQIDRSGRDFSRLVRYTERIAQQCFVPLSVGGGVSTMEQARALFNAGADKIVLNTVCYQNPQLVANLASTYGSQAVVVSIDVKAESGQYKLYAGLGQQAQSQSLAQHIEHMQQLGAGEFLVQRIEHDGMMQGYDIQLLDQVVSLSKRPVIFAAGAGHFAHLLEALQHGADAVGCGSLFNFGDNNPLRAKAFLKNYGIPLKRV